MEKRFMFWKKEIKVIHLKKCQFSGSSVSKENGHFFKFFDENGKEREEWLNFREFRVFLFHCGIKNLPSFPKGREFDFERWFRYALAYSSSGKENQRRISETERLFQIADRFGYPIDISKIVREQASLASLKI